MYHEPLGTACQGPTRRSGQCAAIIDRLTYHGTIIETGTHSYRLAHGRTNAVVG